MKKSELKIKLEILVLLLPYFDVPILMYTNPGIATLMNYWKVGTVPLIIILLYFNHIRPSKIFWLSLLYSFSGLVSVIINGGDLVDGFIMVGMPIAVICIMDYCSNYKIITLEIGTIIFEILAYSNLISIFIYPNGIVSGVGAQIDAIDEQTWYVLGMRNNFVIFLLPGLTFACLYCNYSKNYFRLAVSFFASILQILLTGSSTSFVAITVFGCLVLFQSITINSLYYLGICLLFNVSVVIFSIQDKSRLLAWFISGVLNKTLSFSRRTLIWQIAIRKIKQSPIFGYGNTLHISLLKTGERFYPGSQADHAHNHWLQILINDGIIGLISYMILLISCILQIEKIDNKKNKCVLRASIAAFLVLTLTQPYVYQPRMFFIYALAYIIKGFPNCEKNVKNE